MATKDNSLEVDLLLFGMRRLLVEISQQEEVIASMNEDRVVDFEELKDQ